MNPQETVTTQPFCTGLARDRHVESRLPTGIPGYRDLTADAAVCRPDFFRLENAACTGIKVRRSGSTIRNFYVSLIVPR
jgi:hypothetical protein